MIDELVARESKREKRCKRRREGEGGVNPISGGEMRENKQEM